MGGTVYENSPTSDKHFHAIQKVYPTLANGIVVTGGVAAWALGSFAVLIPANAITDAFDIHFLNIAAYNANDTFEIQLYAGPDGSEVLVGSARVTRTTNVGASPLVHMQMPIQAPNTQIKCKVASQLGTSNFMTLSVQYHTY